MGNTQQGRLQTYRLFFWKLQGPQLGLRSEGEQKSLEWTLLNMCLIDSCQTLTGTCYRLFPAGTQMTHLFIYVCSSSVWCSGTFSLASPSRTFTRGPGGAGCSTRGSFHSRCSKTPVKTCRSDFATLSAVLSGVKMPLSGTAAEWSSGSLMLGYFISGIEGKPYFRLLIL